MTQKLKLGAARSTNNGIIFYSTVEPQIGFKAYLDENGEIQKTMTCDMFENHLMCKSGLIVEKPCIKKWIRILFISIILVFSAILTFLLKKPGFLISALYFCIFALKDLYAFICIISKRNTNKKEHLLLKRFHGAEHMVCNAYDKLHRIPTLEEIKKFSRFSGSCGSMNILNNISYFTTFSVILLLWSEPIFPILAISCVTFMTLSLYGKWMRFLQFTITEPPTDKELLVAIEGLKFFCEMEPFVIMAQNSSKDDLN